MSTYSIEVPNPVVTAMKDDLGDSADGLTNKAVVVLWMRRQIAPISKRYRRKGLGVPSALESARVAAETALSNETAARKSAEDAGDVQAVADAQGVT